MAAICFVHVDPARLSGLIGAVEDALAGMEGAEYDYYWAAFLAALNS